MYVGRGKKLLHWSIFCSFLKRLLICERLAVSCHLSELTLSTSFFWPNWWQEEGVPYKYIRWWEARKITFRGKKLLHGFFCPPFPTGERGGEKINIDVAVIFSRKNALWQPQLVTTHTHITTTHKERKKTTKTLFSFFPPFVKATYRDSATAAANKNLSLWVSQSLRQSILFSLSEMRQEDMKENDEETIFIFLLLNRCSFWVREEREKGM